MADLHTIYNELLFYVFNHAETCTNDDISRAVLDFYSTEDLLDAKNMLWETVGKDHLGVNSARRDSELRSASMALIRDILTAVEKMDEMGIKVRCAALDFKKIPKMSPNELHLPTMVKRVIMNEHKVKELESILAETCSKMADFELWKKEFVKNCGSTPVSVTRSDPAVPPRTPVPSPPMPSAPSSPPTPAPPVPSAPAVPPRTPVPSVPVPSAPSSTPTPAPPVPSAPPLSPGPSSTNPPPTNPDFTTPANDSPTVADNTSERPQYNKVIKKSPPKPDPPVSKIKLARNTGHHDADGDSKEGEWTVVQKRKKRLWITGTKREAGGVPSRITMFATRLVNSYDEDKFRDLLRRGNINPLHCHRFFKEGNSSCSFKFTVKRSDVDKCCNSDMWPEGVSVREWERKHSDERVRNAVSDAYVDSQGMDHSRNSVVRETIDS